MKYTYAYKTSDGKRHEAEMDAPSREDVFVALRAKGIRAIKVVAADGSKANGEWGTGNGERGRGKGHPSPRLRRARGIFRIVFSFLVLLVAAVAIRELVEFRSDLNSTNSNGLKGRGADAALQSFLTSRTRRQVIGDAAVVEKGIASGWSDVFEHEGDRFLASFAVPGVRAGQRNTTVEEIESALGRSVAVSESDGLEARQIKAMVEGMKDEARAYVAAGGTVVGYGKRLTERQDAEVAILARAKAEVDAARGTMPADKFEAFLDVRNDELRGLGLRTIPNSPREAD